MKCLLKYQWVKLPRNQLPPGKGIMGSWARLASRAAFRTGQARYCGYTNKVSAGGWAGGIVGLKSILAIKRRRQALEHMDTLADLGYITYSLDTKTKKLTYQVTDWVVRCSGEPCMGREAVYTTEGYGFLCLPRNVTHRLAERHYGSSTQPVTATRTYPNLANQDLNHLPKSITEGGRTLTLQDVQWQTDNTYNADDYEIGDRFTAVCTYGGSKTVSYVTGYTTTANYSGEVYRTGVTVIRYTVIFTGTPMEPVAEEQSQSGGLNWLMVALPALAALGAGTGGTYFFMKRKERKMYEELAESNDAAAGRHSDDGDTGAGGGV